MKTSLFSETTDKVVSIPSSNWDLFKQYYKLMMYSGDCDPSYPAMNYVADRLELNPSQRYWLAFLYGTNYCLPTTWYIFNEFPDMENIDINRIERWWKINKSRLVFQKDRAKVKNFDDFVKCYESYHSLVGNDQEKAFSQFFNNKSPEERYRDIYKFTISRREHGLQHGIYTFGRFTLFIYLEALNEITDLKVLPDKLDFKDGSSKEPKEGLCYACGLELDTEYYNILNQQLLQAKYELQKENSEINVNIFNIETVLCAYGKLFRGTNKGRYLGYYIDRMQEDILQMEKNVPEGVDWDLLWQFRKEYFDHSLLGELNNWSGIRKSRMTLFNKTKTFLYLNEHLDLRQYRRKQIFNTIGKVYI